ncbi:MAG: TIGR03862 family flavoprotein [Venatoribacter sp.]
MSRNTAAYAVIGAGPAGLMAAEQLALAGKKVLVFDAMKSAARKFLWAGIGGMNITHSEPYEQFVSRYREASPFLRPYLDAFTPTDLRAWIKELGIDTFVGTSGRVFPTEMKAAPLLRAWLARLKKQGVEFKMRHRLSELKQEQGQLLWQFETEQGLTTWQFDKVVLALGGASYPHLGSTGQWLEQLGRFGVESQAFKASNCGFELPWSHYLKDKFAGTALKHIALSLTGLDGQVESKLGEAIFSDYGLEGSLVYALSAPLRELMLHSPTTAQLHLDWLPHYRHEQVITLLQSGKSSDSFSNLLRKKLKLPALANALLKEYAPNLNHKDYQAVAQTLKHLPLPAVTNTRPLAEAISSAGGISLNALTTSLELKPLKNVFVAGEMLDWEAPTGGYLLTACFALGKAAGIGAAKSTTK